jgi:hypothetical protein
MTMTNSEIADLLSMIAAYDQRTVGITDIAAWQSIAEEENWTFPLARRAVIEFHRRDGDRFRMKPANVTDAIRDAEQKIRREVFRTDLIPPRDVDDEIKWRREFITRTKQIALDAWAAGEPLPWVENTFDAPRLMFPEPRRELIA